MGTVRLPKKTIYRLISILFSSLRIFPSGYLGLKAVEQAGNGSNRVE